MRDRDGVDCYGDGDGDGDDEWLRMIVMNDDHDEWIRIIVMKDDGCMMTVMRLWRWW